MSSIEYRRTSQGFAGVSTRQDSGLTGISGYAAMFYRAGDPGTEFELAPGVVERIMPGAFERSIREGDVTALFNHEANLILGRTSSGTLRLREDSLGLYYDIDPPDVTYARDLLVSLRRGDVQGSSFGFAVERETWRYEGGVEIRELHDVTLVDVSPVVNPAYKGTTSGTDRARSRDAGDASCGCRECARLREQIRRAELAQDLDRIERLQRSF